MPARTAARFTSSSFASTIVRPTFPDLMFDKVPEGKFGKNRVHVDLTSADPNAIVQRLMNLDAHRRVTSLMSSPGSSDSHAQHPVGSFDEGGATR
jgi:hypothetical protein